MKLRKGLAAVLSLVLISTGIFAVSGTAVYADPGDPAEKDINITFNFDYATTRDLVGGPETNETTVNPVIYIGTSQNDTSTSNDIHSGDSITARTGSSVFIWLKVNEGYENKRGRDYDSEGYMMGYKLNDDLYSNVFSDAVIESTQENPSTGLWAELRLPGVTNDRGVNWNEITQITVNICFIRKDDPDDEDLPTGTATLTASYASGADTSKVKVIYEYGDDWAPAEVGNSGVSNKENVHMIGVNPSDGYILTDDAHIVISANENPSQNFRYDGRLRDLMESSGYSFVFPEGEYTCTITDVNVRAQTSSDIIGKYKITTEYKNGLNPEELGHDDVGFEDSSGNEIRSGGSEIRDASTPYFSIPEDAAFMFISISNDTDRNHFEKAVLTGYNESGSQVSQATFDNSKIRSEYFDKVPINRAYTYVLSVTYSECKRVYWEYGSGSGNVNHAKIYLLTAEGDESPDSSSRRHGQDFTLQVGHRYYFVLIPDYGYQVRGLSVNGVDILPVSGDANMGIFGFTMGNEDFCLSPVLGSSPDRISNSSSFTSASISNGSAAGVGGNLSMTLSDTATDVSALTAIEDAGTATAVETVDIALDQIVSQGNGTNWKKGLSELDGAITLSVGVAASGLGTGQTYTVVRKHGSDYQKLDAVYNITTGRLTFATDKFSEYTVVKIPGTPARNSSGGGSSGGSSGGGSGSSRRLTINTGTTETRTNPDGSTTETKTNLDGSKTETTTNSDGSKEEKTTKTDGTVIDIKTGKDGNSSISITDPVLGTAENVPRGVIEGGQVYRLYNPNTGEHVYTRNIDEMRHLNASGWAEENGSGDTAVLWNENGAQSVYRVYDPCSGMHHFTRSQAEAAYLKGLGWKYEGVSFYVYASDSGKGRDAYRLYNPNNGEHFYTTDKKEQEYLSMLGWNYEGVAWDIK